MCQMCMAEEIIVKENLFGRLYLAKSQKETKGWPAGQYALSFGSNPEVVFPDIKWVAEPPEFDDEAPEQDDPAYSDLFARYVKAVNDVNAAIKVSPTIGHAIYQECLDQGFSAAEHGHVMFCIYDIVCEAVFEHREKEQEAGQ